MVTVWLTPKTPQTFDKALQRHAASPSHPQTQCQTVPYTPAHRQHHNPSGSQFGAKILSRVRTTTHSHIMFETSSSCRPTPTDEERAIERTLRHQTGLRPANVPHLEGSHLCSGRERRWPEPLLQRKWTSTFANAVPSQVHLSPHKPIITSNDTSVTGVAFEMLLSRDTGRFNCSETLRSTLVHIQAVLLQLQILLHFPRRFICSSSLLSRSSRAHSNFSLFPPSS